jgi:hypothetical protein
MSRGTGFAILILPPFTALQVVRAQPYVDLALALHLQPTQCFVDSIEYYYSNSPIALQG